jgi:hypothetical protein
VAHAVVYDSNCLHGIEDRGALKCGASRGNEEPSFILTKPACPLGDVQVNGQRGAPDLTRHLAIGSLAYPVGERKELDGTPINVQRLEMEHRCRYRPNCQAVAAYAYAYAYAAAAQPIGIARLAA